ncbi:tRNA 2-thiouridine synthesizing protein E [Erwinia amylovora MR1]|nr:tRNA 2-thiouridine synthesizing protein E [Erwinia amylovora MR1]
MLFNGKEIARDAQGYLKSITDWSEDLARELAAEEKLN